MRDTVADSHRLSFIDKRKMREFDALCFKPIADYDSRKIRALCERYNLSQSVLAAILNASLSRARQWEIGAKHPSGPSLKLLHLLDEKGLEALV